MKHLAVLILLLFFLCENTNAAVGDTLNKSNACGKFVFAYQTTYNEIKIRRTKSFVFKTASTTAKGKWEIKNDTLFLLYANGSKKKMVMHNGKFHLVSGANKTDLNAFIPKSDYKYYIRQCKRAGK